VRIKNIFQIIGNKRENQEKLLKCMNIFSFLFFPLAMLLKRGLLYGKVQNFQMNF